jgi:hypothetical protein
LVKECPNCHNIEDDSSVFCSKCGCRFESRISVSEVPIKPEEVVWMGKPHPLFFLESPIFWIGVILLIPYFIFFPIPVIVGAIITFIVAPFAFRLYQKGQTTPAIIIFILLGIFFCLPWILMFLGYVDGVLSLEYLISRDKIFITKKFVGLTKREVLLKEVRDVVVEVNFLGRLLGYGNVIPLTGGMIDLWAVSRSTLKHSIIRGVPNPEHIEKVIRSLITSKSK